MNSLLNWLTSPEWAHVVKALLHSLWQGALIAAGAAGLMRRFNNPAVRYRFAMAALGTLLLTSFVTWGVLNAPKHRATANLPAPESAPISPITPSGPVEKIVVTAHRTSTNPKMQWTAWLALAWLLGASVMLGRASVKVAGAEQLRRACQPLDDSRITELLAEARRAVKLTRRVRVAVMNQLTSPAVVGVIVPTLILPLSLLTTLSLEQLRFVLLHELAHIRRGDYLANLFQLFAEALFFFNPAVWWLSHQIRREREACCDALAIELSGAPVDYARTLVSVAETMLTPPASAAPAFGDRREPSALADRVQRVLVPGYRPSLRLTWRAMLAALAVGGGLLGMLAAGTRETVAATAALVGAEQAPVKAASQSDSKTSTNVARAGMDAQHTNASPREGASTVAAEPGLPNIGTMVINPSTGLPDLKATIGSTVTNEGLATRMFKIPSNELVRVLGELGPVVSTNRFQSFHEFFDRIGVDTTVSGKSIFYSEGKGGLFVRAKREDLDRIESALQESLPLLPQVNIAVKFIEMPEKLASELLTNLVSKNTRGEISGTMTESQARAFFKSLEKAKGAEILSAPQVTTMSGRQAQLQISQMQTVVTGLSTVISANGAKSNIVQSFPMPFGTTLDVVPFVTADGNAVQIDAIPSVTEFLGYVDPARAAESTRPAVISKLPVASAAGFLPHYNIRQTVAAATVLDGQTFVFGNFLSEFATRQPDGSVVREPDPNIPKKRLYIFLTPTIVDAAGNPVHPALESRR